MRPITLVPGVFAQAEVQLLHSFVESEQLAILEMYFRVTQVTLQKFAKLTNCPDAFSSQKRADGLRRFLIGNEFAVLLHCPRGLAQPVYHIPERHEHAKVRLF